MESTGEPLNFRLGVELSPLLKLGVRVAPGDGESKKLLTWGGTGFKGPVVTVIISAYETS
jgi:hypothetical protein